MTSDAYWWLALGLGLLVAVVAVVLLQIFLREVHRIERGVGLVWTAGKQVTRNTATTWLLPETSNRLDLLTDEALRHVDLLSPTAPAAPMPPKPVPPSRTGSTRAGS